MTVVRALLIVLLVAALLAALPPWPGGLRWGYGRGLVSALLLLVLIMLLSLVFGGPRIGR